MAIEEKRTDENQNSEGKLLNAGLVLLAVLSLGLAAWTVAVNQFRAGTDDLFLILMCLLIALVAMINPTVWLYKRGFFEQFMIREEPAAPAAAEGHAGHGEHEFEGTNRLFITVWVALLLLTALEVLLAYEQVDPALMLVIVMGASIIKAALIMAYFMHLRFERLSLVLTLVPAMVVCLCLMMIIFPDSKRLLHHRPPAPPAVSTGR
jgi:caa(3)-type oxidase subunit IV